MKFPAPFLLALVLFFATICPAQAISALNHLIIHENAMLLMVGANAYPLREGLPNFEQTPVPSVIITLVVPGLPPVQDAAGIHEVPDKLTTLARRVVKYFLRLKSRDLRPLPECLVRSDLSPLVDFLTQNKSYFLAKRDPSGRAILSELFTDEEPFRWSKTGFYLEFLFNNLHQHLFDFESKMRDAQARELSKLARQMQLRTVPKF